MYQNLKISKNLKKSLFFKKSENFENTFFCRKKKKKCYPLTFPILGERNSTRALHSARFRIQGGSPERDTPAVGVGAGLYFYYWMDWIVQSG